MITQRLLCLALFALAASSALTNYAAAQSDACAQGYVWREAFDGDHVCVSPDTRERAKSDNANAAELRANKGSDECVQGFVWRLANPEDHVCVPQITREQTAQDNELAYSRLASGPPTPLPPKKEAAVPLPPAKAGCYVFKEVAWQEIPCATQEETKKLRPPAVHYSIKNQPRLIQQRIQLAGQTYVPYTLPLKHGSIDIELGSDPALGTVLDVLPQDTPCLGEPGKPAPVYTANSFSIQLNTNQFTTPYDNQGGVQFVYQTAPGQDLLCVWKIDVSVQGYEPICVPTERGTFLGSAATGTRPQSARVTGMIISSDDGKTMLSAMGGFSWARGGPPLGFYMVVTTDTITGTTRGLANDPTQYPLGLSGRWTQVSGDIYGNGCGSKAVFTGVNILERR